MWEFILNLFGSAAWEPHGHCFAWTQPLLGVMVVSNLLIGLAYFSIPFVLIQLVRKRKDLVHRPVFLMFAVFILGCGTTHFVKLWTIYEPVYRLQAWVDAATALASVGTAALLWPILPAVLRLPSPTQLQAVNEELGREIQVRRQAQTDLQQTNDVLEFRVQERTKELEQINTALEQAHEAADRESRRLRAVLDALPVGVFIADANGAIVETNEAARHVWGGDAPLAGQADEYHIYKGRLAATGKPLQAADWGLARALKGETTVGELVEIERFNGTPGVIVNSAAPILNAESELVGAVAVSVDVTAQQMAEEALRDSEARLSGIIDSAMDAIISVNEDQNIILFNHAAETIFGISAHEAMGKPLSEFIPARYRDVHEHHVATFRETGKTHRSMKDPPTVPALRADGTEFPIEATISQVVVSGERIYTVILRDVTAQMQAGEERRSMLESLQREQVRLKAIIEQVPSGLTIREASGKLVMFSAATPDLLGHPLALTTDYSSYQNVGAVHQDGTPYATEEYPMTRALGGEHIVQEPMIYRRGDSSLTVLSVNASPMRDESGAIIGAISTFSDISEQRRAEETQSLLASIVENTEDSIVGKDLDGIIISWNKGAERIYGYTRDQAIGKPIQLIFPPERADEETLILERIRRGESLTDYETDRKRADGSIIHVSLTVSPVRDVTGRIVGASAITRDITTRVEQERRHQELLKLEQQARIAAEEASDLKSEFLGMVSHELRTPLTSIMGFASTLLADDVSFEPDVQRDFINIINIESGKLKDLVEQLLDVTRIQAKTLRIQQRPQPLANALEVAQPQLNTLAEEHPIEISIPDDLPLIYADEKRIGQVIVNLVDNSVKFSPEGTPITVSASANGANEVRIEVADQGIGIPPEQREWVFEPFRQVGEQFTSRGAGLGLAICKGLVEAHGGRIWIESNEKRGTTIVFTIPTAP